LSRIEEDLKREVAELKRRIEALKGHARACCDFEMSNELEDRIEATLSGQQE
jgi:hypothetical protein